MLSPLYRTRKIGAAHGLIELFPPIGNQMASRGGGLIDHRDYSVFAGAKKVTGTFCAKHPKGRLREKVPVTFPPHLLCEAPEGSLAGKGACHLFPS